MDLFLRTQSNKTSKSRLFLAGRVTGCSLLVLVNLVVMMGPSCIGSVESWAPIGRIGKGQAAHTEPVEAGQEEEEGAEGVEQGHY